MSKGKTVVILEHPGSWVAIFLALIRFYQKYISPLKPAACRFYPSCSQYCYEAVLKYGIVRGGFMGASRILRCHPFHPGGYDPVD